MRIYDLKTSEWYDTNMNDDLHLFKDLLRQTLDVRI